MAGVEAYNNYSSEYDNWYELFPNDYEAEIKAVKALLPIEPLITNKCLEIGVGTGRFAAPLKIDFGIDPSKEMLKQAFKRGIKTIQGKAEELPFQNSCFDFVITVTASEFFDDPQKAFCEMYRILKPEGKSIVAFIDSQSELGKKYNIKKQQSKFYKYANFFSVKEITTMLEKAQFSCFKFRQTLFTNQKEHDEKIKTGYGIGGFVVVSAVKST